MCIRDRKYSGGGGSTVSDVLKTAFTAARIVPLTVAKKPSSGWFVFEINLKRSFMRGFLHFNLVGFTALISFGMYSCCNTSKQQSVFQFKHWYLEELSS